MSCLNTPQGEKGESMKIIKRNAIIIAVILFVGVAVYLNWAYNRQETKLADAEPGQEVAGVLDTAGSEDLFYSAPAPAPALAAADAVTEYFTSARLTRQQARDSAISTLREAAETETESSSALNAITDMAKYTVTEAEIESLVMAKGFDDCLVFLDDDSVIVAVAAPFTGLNASAVSRITDIVLEETALSTEQIKIIEVK